MAIRTFFSLILGMLLINSSVVQAEVTPSTN